MSKRVAIVQSSYIPWKGFFDIIRRVDEFILYDDVQFTRRDWRNRNQIKTAQGLHWLSIPVKSKGRYEQLICETEISEPSWAEQHWQSIRHAYGKAPAFATHGARLQKIFESAAQQTLLSSVNGVLLREICAWLGLNTKITSSLDYVAQGSKTERLVSLCLASKATAYLSGPSAKAYMEPEQFSAHNIALDYIDYGPYPTYAQLHGAFVHTVAIVDLLLHMGDNAKDYIKPEAA